MTNEYITDSPNGGGLGQYLYRISLALRDLGHDVEVFTKAAAKPQVFDFEGIRVTCVARNRNLSYRLMGRLGRAASVLGMPLTRKSVALASNLAKAFSRRHRERPFDFVQSGSPGLSGLFIRGSQSLRHIVRLSSISQRWMEIDGVAESYSWWDRQLYAYLERRLFRRSSAAYAPSRLVADYYRTTYGIDVGTLRPPACLAHQPSCTLPVGLPERFLLHFGTLSALKGSDVLAQALPLAWKQAPDLTMVWAGRERHGTRFADFAAAWGDRAGQVVYLGSLNRPDLYAVWQRSLATVAPSRLDNLPNTVIESLLHNVPVIGSQGASIDELVEDGVSGELVPIEDEQALAAALVRAWRGDSPWLGSGFRPPALLNEMQPRVAAQRLIDLAMQVA